MRNLTKLFLFFILACLFASCSSTARFTNDDEGSVYTEEINSEEYNSSSILESSEGTASYYAHKFHGRKTANGETYDMYKLTAAHSNYPFGTIIRVTNLSNNKSVVLRINDRQPGFKGRILDMSLKAAEELDMITSGISKVRIEVLKWGDR